MEKFEFKLSIILFFILVSSPCFGQHGLLAEYYDGINFDKYVTKEYVDNINDYWDNSPPVNGIDPHYCSVRWSGKIVAGKTATYLFSAIVDDGIRVWIDGELIINQWDLHDLGVFQGKKVMEAFKQYDIKVEYFNALNEAEVKLMWDIEKAYEDQSWGEYFFGVDYDFKPIPMTNFIIPPEKIVAMETPEIKDPPAIKKEKPTIIPKPKPKAKSQNEVLPVKKEQLPPPVKKEVMTIEKAQKYIPKDVQFARAKAEVLESSFNELNTFAKFMLDNPKVSVTIEGHTDVVGDKVKNQELSENRAKKIASYLIEKGISSSRIITVGYGESKPLKKPEDGEYYPPNRRVVFKLSGL